MKHEIIHRFTLSVMAVIDFSINIYILLSPLRSFHLCKCLCHVNKIWFDDLVLCVTLMLLHIYCVVCILHLVFFSFCFISVLRVHLISSSPNTINDEVEATQQTHNLRAIRLQRQSSVLLMCSIVTPRKGQWRLSALKRLFVYCIGRQEKDMNLAS